MALVSFYLFFSVATRKFEIIYGACILYLPDAAALGKGRGEIRKGVPRR